MEIYFRILMVFLFYSLFAVEHLAQMNEYPVAPEVWSTPEEIAVIHTVVDRAESPSISFDGEKLYFNWIGVTEKTDTGWTTPIRLNNNINQHLADMPCISPNGKRLYFSWYVNYWDLYYSDWDSVTNDWGIAKPCDIAIKEPDYLKGGYGCSLPDDSTIIFLNGSSAFISHFNFKTQSWDTATGFPTLTLQTGSDYGIYVSPGLKKIYSSRLNPDTTIDGKPYADYDIFVRYRDTSNSRGYTGQYVLNFCLQSDTLYFADKYTERFEGYPTLTPDGKTMYFTANYHGTSTTTTIYVSHLLIDENGDTVTSILHESKHSLPESMKLYPVYPNPFNPNLRIRYSLNKESDISLIVYDVLGKEVQKIFEGRKPAGEFEETFDGKYMPSGIYLIKLSSKESMQVQKAVLVK